MAKPIDPKAALRAKLRTCCEEIIDMEIEHRDTFERFAGLKARARQMVADLGEPVREVFNGKGIVKGSPGHDKQFEGEFPEVDIDGFNALAPARREALLAKWPVRMVGHWKKAYGGRIETDLFPRPAA
jgi:hypothetical protein